MTVKSWFMDREFTTNERIAIGFNDPAVQRETEKAFLLKWDTDYGVITHWVPKSCIISDEEIAAENTPEKCAARAAATKAREERYQALIDLCKANGIKARKGWRVATMKEKLAAAGVKY